MSYNKHNLRKARHNAALRGYAYFIVKREMAHVEVCHNMLTNPVYIGKIAFGRRSKERVKGTKDQYHMVHQADYMLEEGKHEAIIDMDIWDIVRKKRDRTGVIRASSVPYKRIHLLTGLIKCPKCGGPMYAQKYSYTNIKGEYSEYFKYECLNRHRVKGTFCDYYGAFRKELLDGTVINVVLKLINNEKFIEKVSVKLQENFDTYSIKMELKNYQDKYEDVIKKKEYLENEIDSIPFENPNRNRIIVDLQKRLYSQYDIIVELEKNIADLTLKIKGASNKFSSSIKVISILKHFNKIYEKATKEEQKNLLMLLIKKIEINDAPDAENAIKSIEFNFPINFDKNNKDVITMSL